MAWPIQIIEPILDRSFVGVVAPPVEPPAAGEPACTNVAGWPVTYGPVALVVCCREAKDNRP